jgi:membrane protease YdiL (CAAX protease family)
VYHSAVLPELPPLPAAETHDTPLVERNSLTRARAVAEVVVCSGFPTQLLIVAALTALGVRPGDEGELAPTFVFLLSAADTVLLLGLVCLFLRASNDRLRDVFLGARPSAPEFVFGVLCVPLTFLLVVLAQLLIRVLLPSLHNVEVSPFTPLLESAWLLAGFVLLVLIAGGVREELQRAVLLRRFEQRLGGGPLGVLITSTAFGLGHTVQGWDAAIITGTLGALWGLLYLQRRSVVATVTNHALFNLAQIVLGYVTIVRT